MSKSYGNTIGLTAGADEIRSLVATMFTDPNRVRRSDPAIPTSATSFTSTNSFRTTLPSPGRSRVPHRADRLRAGQETAAEIIIERLAPLRARREEIDRNPSIVWDVLREGTAKRASAPAKPWPWCAMR